MSNPHLGCDLFQGFYFARPASPEDLAELLAGPTPTTTASK